MVDADVIRDRKQFYVQEGEIELRNAMYFLHLHCDNWNPSCEQTFRELVNHAAAFLAKASAMDDLLATQ